MMVCSATGAFVPHSYYASSTGTGFRAREFATRKEAEAAMWSYCSRHGISVECTECDRHERKYSDHKGARFYINRI